jgi:MFS family permease
MTESTKSPVNLDQESASLSIGTLVASCAAVCLAQIGLVLPAAINGVMQRTLETSGSELTWISAAFLVPIAMFSLTFGLLGDRYGRKRMLVAGSALMAVGYVISASAGSVHQLWIGQALCGIGAAALFPSSLAAITAVTPGAKERAKGLAAWTTALSTGALIAPPLSGAIVEHTSFFWAFGVLAGIAALTAVLVLTLTRESTAPQTRALDWPGQVTIAAALLTLLFGIIEGPTRGWGSPSVAGAFVAAAVLLAAFVAIELRSASPLLQLRLFRIRTFSAASVVAVVGMFGFLGGAYALSIQLGVIQHKTPLQAAIPFIVIQGITPFIWPLLVRLLRHVGPRVMLVTGLISIAAGQIWLAALPATGSGLIPMLPALVLIGFGFGLLVSAITAAAVNAVPINQTGMASATTSVVRDLGQTMGPALIGTIALTQAGNVLAGKLDGAGLTAPQRHIVDAISADGGPIALASAQLGPISQKVGPLAQDALAHGYNTGFMVSAAACVLAAVIAAVFLGDGKQQAEGLNG